MNEELFGLIDKAIHIYESDLSWEEKYDLIFSAQISRKIFKLIRLDYYDPDTTYEADCEAFISALREAKEKYSRIEQGLKF